MDFLRTLAPTVATALLGPLGGAAVSAIGSILGISDATQTQIKDAISKGQMTPEQVSKIKELELQYQNDEKERGFKYEELVVRDRMSARSMAVDGGTAKYMFYLSLFLLCLTLGTEVWVLFKGYPESIPEIIVGRVLGLMDAVALLVLNFHYGSSSGSQMKSSLLAVAQLPQTK